MSLLSENNKDQTAHMSARLSMPLHLKRRLVACLKALRRIPREELSPAAAALEDNGRMLFKEIEALENTLSSCPRLPSIEKTPRIQLFARGILADRDLPLSASLILRRFRECPEETEWEHAELLCLSPALYCAVFEKVNRILSFCLSEAGRCQKAQACLRQGNGKRWAALTKDALLFEAVYSLLTTHEKADALAALEEAAGGETEAILARARKEKTEWEQETRQCLQAVRGLPRLPFQGILERVSPLCALLRQDDTYRRMDTESRNDYLGRVCQIARKRGLRASTVARAALALCQGKEGVENECGYYLIERPDLIDVYLMKRKKPSFLSQRRQSVYAACLLGGVLVFLLAGLILRLPFFVMPFFLLCGSEFTHRLTRFACRKRFSPRMLPRLSPRSLSDEKLLITVPALLLSAKQVLRLSRRLAVLKTAAPQADILLLGDFADSETETRPEDEAILYAAKAALQALNDEFGGGFMLWQRRRVWDAGQEAYCGRERKRGALEMLNRTLLFEDAQEDTLYSSFEPDQIAGKYSYVLTLDADTYLPPHAAEKLLGAMQHPLQKGRVGVIQPRMETAPDRAVTWAQALLGGRGGVDVYGQSYPDLYQDAFGRGSFVGKGLYAPKEWMNRLEGKVPKGRLLSHDLYEGERVSSALAHDIVLYDGHPSSLSGWQKRLHRWTRGDWQLLPYLLDSSLDLLSRLKIWDNLRRSLIPPAQLALLILGTALGAPLLCLLALPYPFKGMGMRLLLLPGKACTLMDAACRALYRQFISKKRLLSWVTAEQAESGKSLPFSCLAAQLLSGAALIIFSLLPGGFLPMIWLGILWVVSPLLSGKLDLPMQAEKPMNEKQKAEVRDLAKSTWRFFAATVTEKTHFLPPDNLQSEPDRGLAMRTSPTNIGLYLLSCAAARKLSIITTAEMARRMESAVSTLEGLERWHGHFFNWYDLTDLTPLFPQFVSTVDSGNFSVCAAACAQVCRQHLAEMNESFRSLPARLDALSRAADFALLFNKTAGLFSIGYDTRKQRLSSACYDLIASEARTASYFAIMQGQIPLSHWERLNRSAVRLGGGAALLSWGGTMFEYLMPGLVLPMPGGTLLGEGCFSAVRAQIAYAGRWPFGVSESGYYAFDPELNYQYRAFGLPALALSSEVSGKVTAPYASMLAMPYFPWAAAENLRRMKKRGWMNEYGLYEAVDFSPQRVESAPRVVMSHMAHHQGMVLCSVCNALTDFSLVRAFMTLPAAQAAACLLWEKAPPLPRRQYPLPPPRLDSPALQYRGRAAHAGFPLDAHALFGNGLSWVMNNQGEGYLSANGMMISRFYESAEAPGGLLFYLRDEVTGNFIRPAAAGQARFENGYVLYSAEAFGLQFRMRCFVTPLRGIAVASLTLENTEKAEKEIEAVSCLEIAQGSQKADRAHPNFRDLSVQVSEWKSNGLLSRRLPREESDRMPLIFHSAVGDIVSLRRQGDRRLFFGRNGNENDPAQLHFPASECAFRTGDVLSPCLSLRVKMRVPPRKKKTVHFLTFVRPNEQEAKNCDLIGETIPAQFALCATQAQMTLRFLHIDGSMLPIYQQILGALVFSGQPHQFLFPPAPRSALWESGVSGDLPVLLVSLKSPDKALIHHAVKAHAWMRALGIWTDLVFFCPEETEYDRPIRDLITHFVTLSGNASLFSAAGGVHVISGPAEKEEALKSRARLFLSGGISIQRQLSSLRRPPAPAARFSARQPAAVLPPPLGFFNGYGGFTEDHAYCIPFPPAVPWHQLLPGERFGTLVSDSGILTSFGDNCRLSPLTSAPRNVHSPDGSEEYCIRDEEGNLYPLIRCTAYFSPGTAEYKTLCGSVYSHATVFSCMDRPMGIRQIVLRSGKETRLRFYAVIRFSMGEREDETGASAEPPFAFSQNGEKGKIGWAAMRDSTVTLFASGEREQAFSLSAGGGQGNTAVFTRDILLRPHEPTALVVALGLCGSEQEARDDFDALNRLGAQHFLRACREYWQEKLSGLTLFSGNAALMSLLNRWLPYQVRASRLMTRMGPYQTGGAFGFRDQLQDLLALLHTDPSFARAHLLLCAAHQFQEGDVQHWWHPPKSGVRTRISDDKLFLPYLTALYVEITGDHAILAEETPYLLSSPLAEDEEERYETPECTAYSETLYAHCLKAIDSVAFGAHGLPLMGNGDWNDGMNRVGGRSGESVWLGFFLAYLLKKFIPLCPDEEKDRLSLLRRQLMDHAENAWSGKWYLRAWQDDGTPLGGVDTRIPRIDLITQCFACLAGMPRQRAREAVYHAVDLLYDSRAGLVKLLSPPFAPEEGAGYIGAYVPGVRENGGQYTHAVPWLIMALCALGENDLAWEIAQAVLPLSHGDSEEKIKTYQLEPYVLCGDVYAGQNLGRGGWSWYTGSAAWLYFVFFTILLGFEKRGDQARLAPCARRDMEEYTLVYRFGASYYHFTAAREALFPTLDGEKLSDGWVRLQDDGKTHEARYPLK